MGWRLRDWSMVWYERIGEPDAEGNADIGLYRVTTGGPGWREPMEGEVAWLPIFDPARCESKVKREREAMQKQILNDAYSYLNLRDADELLALEERLDQKDFVRWHAWFREAKKWKQKDLKRRRNRRQKRSEPFLHGELGVHFVYCVRSGSHLPVGGDAELAAEVEAQIDSEISSDDGYCSDHDRRFKNKPTGAGNPANRSGSGDGRFPGPSNQPSSSSRARKRQRQDDKPMDGFFDNLDLSNILGMSDETPPSRNPGLAHLSASFLTPDATDRVERSNSPGIFISQHDTTPRRRKVPVGGARDPAALDPQAANVVFIEDDDNNEGDGNGDGDNGDDNGDGEE